MQITGAEVNEQIKFYEIAARTDFRYEVSSISRLVQLLRRLLSVQEVWGLIPRPVKSDTVSATACHRCGASPEMRCPGANCVDGPRHSLHDSA